MTEILLMDDMTTAEKVDHEKVMQMLSKAPKHNFDNEFVILHGSTYTADELKMIAPQK